MYLKNNKLRLLGGLGWTWSRSLGEFIDEELEEFEVVDWNSGFNLNFGLTYDLSSRIFLQTQYDLSFISGDSSNLNVGLIKVGGGLRF